MTSRNVNSGARSTPAPSLSSRVNSLIGFFAPSLALSREKATLQRNVLVREASHYNAAGRSNRTKDFRVNRSDAVEANRNDAQRLSWIGRDMLRNNPRVVKIRRQLVNNVVGAGIQPSVRWLGQVGDQRASKVNSLIKSHCLTTDFDTDGLKSMLGMQGLSFGSTVVDGEILLRRRFRRMRDGFGLNFQVQALEGDYLNRMVDGTLPNGNLAVQGIEFNRIGRRVAYHIFEEHPGGRFGGMPKTKRVTADNVIHLFEPTRPGQARGVSWLAPVITLLHELQKYQDGQVKRQEIAAMFAAVLQTDMDGDELDKEIPTMQPGSVMAIGSEENMTFTDPPKVDGYEPFMKVTDRSIAAAMGITYEALTGDYSNVNYTSGRMGRMDVDPNVRDWQQNLMISVVCAGFERWIKEAAEDVHDIPRDLWELTWTPPVRPVIDPTKDYKANETAMRSGQKSRRQVIREGGGDPDKVEAEILEERTWESENEVSFSSNAAPASTEPQPDQRGDDA